MITENLPMTCPVCGEKSGNPPLLTRDGNSLRCPKNHCFDISSKGYVNLLLSQHNDVWAIGTYCPSRIPGRKPPATARRWWPPGGCFWTAARIPG